MPDHNDLASLRQLSPRRNSTDAETLDQLVAEQLEHFGIDPSTDCGKTLSNLATRLYQASGDVHELWRLSLETISDLPRAYRIAYFNSKKFLSFQTAKLLDTLQNPFRHSYQSLGLNYATQASKGPYPIFDNVTAIFSATPVITRTATYIYACAEWIEDAFKGK